MYYKIIKIILWLQDKEMFRISKLLSKVVK